MQDNSPITTPFGFDSTAADAVAEVDLQGRRAIVTGASSGIGVETARALAGAGAQVTLAVRDTAAGQRAAADIMASTGRDDVSVARLDLADQTSVSEFAEAWEGPLHILVNNAGVMAIPTLELTGEGWEKQFATNHLGHFTLTRELQPALAAGASTSQNARVVALSSVAHLRAGIDFDDLHFARRPYDPMIAYGQSKTANVLFAVEASRRWAVDGITVNAVHPGAIADSNLSRYMDPEVLANLRESDTYTFKTVEQGAATSVAVATWPGLEGIGGRYFEHGAEAEVVDPAKATGQGVAPYALDAALAERLWTVSEELVEGARA